LVHLLREGEGFVAVPAAYQERARELDGHYLQPRYPSSFAEGYPAELYDEGTAERWVKHGEECIALVEESIS
jgi:HEPN domain-containing protein